MRHCRKLMLNFTTSLLVYLSKTKHGLPLKSKTSLHSQKIGMSAADGGMSTYSQQFHQSSVFAWLANIFCGHTDGACREAQHGAKASKSSQACVRVRERVQSISTHWTSPNVPVKLYLPQRACSIEHTASIREPFCNSTRRVFPRSTHAKLCTCLRRSQLTTSDRASLN